MSETTSTTPETGSAELTVSDAASAFLGMMGEAEGADNSQPEAEAPAEEQEAQGEAEGDEPEAQADEQEGEEEDEQPKYRVKAAGEEREVTLDELIKSYQFGQDYTKKSQMVAEERRALEAEKQAVSEAKAMRDQYAQRLQAMEQILEQQAPKEDLEALKDIDPIGYAVKVAEQSQREKQLMAVRAEQQRIAAIQEQENLSQLEAFVAQESKKLVELVPDFADAEKAKSIGADIRNYGKRVGFTEEQLSKVYDSRFAFTLYNATQYLKLMDSKPQVTKKVTEAPKLIKSGVAVSAKDSDVRMTQKLKANAKQSGKIADAAAVFERFL